MPLQMPNSGPTSYGPQGGQLNLFKCYYNAFRPSINYKTNTVTYSSINFEKGITVKSRMDGSSHTLQSLPPNEAKRTLGVMLSPEVMDQRKYW